MISALRLIFLTPEELEGECGGSWNRPLLHAPVSAANERKVASALRARLLLLLEEEGTSLEEDLGLLASLGGSVDAAAKAAEEEAEGAEVKAGAQGTDEQQGAAKAASVFDLLDAVDAEDKAEEEAETMVAEQLEEAVRREEMRCAVQLRANRKILLVECVALLEGFLSKLGEADDGEAKTVPNLHDAFDDYMPNIRLT